MGGGQSYKDSIHKIELVQVQCCFTSTETISSIRDRESGMTTSTSTHLLSPDRIRQDCSPFRTRFKFVSMFLYVRRNHKAYWGQGAHDGHLDFHVVPELCD